MSRPRKMLKFAQMLNPLSVSDLKALKSEVVVAIRLKEQEERRNRNELEARKLRDKVKIGAKITFQPSSPKDQIIKAAVIGIFANKVQVEVNGRKRSVSLTRIITVD